MSLLKKVLDSIEATYDELSEEEKKTLEQYEETLSIPEITIDDVKTFIPAEIARIVQELENYRNSEKKEIYLKARLRNMRALEVYVLQPERDRARLKKELKTRFNLDN